MGGRGARAIFKLSKAISKSGLTAECHSERREESSYFEHLDPSLRSG